MKAEELRPSAGVEATGEQRTVLALLRRAEAFLARKGVGNPRLDAEVLLADLLGVDRVGVYVNFDRPLGGSEVALYRERVRRRGRREPLQQIRGRQEFHSRDFVVTPDVLVPRAETEELVAETLAAVREIAAPRILEIGCGAGAVAVTLALERPQARVFASDVSPAAVAVAAANAERHRAAVELRSGDLFAPWRGERFDAVVSNPPYVARGDLEALEPEVRDHEPRLALDGGEDGLDFHRRLAPQARAALVDGGALLLELGAGQREDVERLYVGFAVAAVRRDLAGVERVIRFRAGAS